MDSVLQSIRSATRIVARTTLNEYWLTENGIFRFQKLSQYSLLAGSFFGVAIALAVSGLLVQLSSWSFFLLAFVFAAMINSLLTRGSVSRLAKIRTLPVEEGERKATEKIAWSFVDRLTVGPSHQLKAALKPLTDYGFADTRFLGSVEHSSLKSLGELASSKIGDQFLVDGREAVV